jgi:hypothetical protein
VAPSSGGDQPDLHAKDTEFLLRALAMLEHGTDYTESMVKFLNGYAKKAQSYNLQRIEYLRRLLESFFEACKDLRQDTFFSATGRFSVTIFESVCVAVCRTPYHDWHTVSAKVIQEDVDRLRIDPEFLAAAQKGTTSARNVRARLTRAELIFLF